MLRVISSLVVLVVLTTASPALREKVNGTLSCPAYGLDCVFHDIIRAQDSRSWQECSVQCFNHKTCEYWSWRTPDNSVNAYGCWLKSRCDLTLQDSYVISGHYDCIQ